MTKLHKVFTPTLCAAVLLLLTLGALPASADTVTSIIGNPNDDISGFSGPYATVTIDLTSSTTATITFTSLTNGGNIFLFGDGGSVDVNVNATSWTLSNIQGFNSGTGFHPGAFTDGGSGQVDGFGVFNQTINSFDGFTHSSDTISFNLTNTSGTWSSATNVLAANADGFDAAMHVFVTSSPANASNGAIATGFASETAGSFESSPTPPPGTEPSSLLVIGSGLIGLGSLVRRRLKKS
jgi:hypothetical protein